MKNKIFCILNPLAADGACYREWPFVESLLKDEGVEYELVLHEGDLRKKTRDVLTDLSSKNELNNAIIAGLGGDGTHHALINGIMDFRAENPSSHPLPPYAIIPLGTGNNIAKSFGLDCGPGKREKSIRKAVATALHGKDHKVDLGKACSLYFLDAFTIGTDAHILAGRNRDKIALSPYRFFYRLFKGYPLYVYNTIKSLGICAPVHGKIEVDGKEWYSGKFFNLVINNSAIYAGEFDLTGMAPADDGELDAIVFTGPVDYLNKYMMGHRYLPKKLRELPQKLARNMHHTRGKTFTIELESELSSQIDGEELPNGKKFKVETLEKILTIKV